MEAGIYNVFLSVTSPLNCRIECEFDSWIAVLEGPETGFECSHTDPDIINNTVVLIVTTSLLKRVPKGYCLLDGLHLSHSDGATWL